VVRRCLETIVQNLINKGGEAPAVSRRICGAPQVQAQAVGLAMKLVSINAGGEVVIEFLLLHMSRPWVHWFNSCSV